MDKSLNRGMFNTFESRKSCVAGYQCDNIDFDFCFAEHKFPVIKIRSDEERDDCQQLKPKRTEASFRTTRITVTILFIIPVLLSPVMVNVLGFVLRVVFFHLILYGTCTMLCVGILHYQQVLCWSLLMAARWFK